MGSRKDKVGDVVRGMVAEYKISWYSMAMSENLTFTDFTVPEPAPRAAETPSRLRRAIHTGAAVLLLTSPVTEYGALTGSDRLATYCANGAAGDNPVLAAACVANDMARQAVDSAVDRLIPDFPIIRGPLPVLK
jgi:hypothetical protein